MNIGYARVSTRDQNLEAQLEQLRAADCEKIFEGKMSGAGKQNEQQLDALIEFAREGDVVIVTKLDRLGRSLRVILSAIERIHEKGASLSTLDGAINTTSKSPFTDALISMIGLFAQLERDLILDRTTEGRERAMAEGRHMGRPREISKEVRQQIRRELAAGASISATANKHKITRPTVRRIRDEES